MTDLGFDLNCDLGEGESPERTAELMALLDSANIACGGHAGTDATMQNALALARQHGVRAGAHPGIPDVAGFGRDTSWRPSADDLAAWLVEQVGRLQRLAASERMELHHLKLHGALYHLSDQHADLAEAYLSTVAHYWPRCRVYARAGGRVSRLGSDFDLEIWPELFLDRGYQPDGSLVPRGTPGALLSDPATIAQRASAWRAGRPWQSHDGSPILLTGRTACIHGDSPHAPALLAAARTELHR